MAQGSPLRLSLCSLLYIDRDMRICPPEIVAILTDEGNDQIAAVMICCHFHLIPTDGHFIAIADCAYILWRGDNCYSQQIAGQARCNIKC